MKKEKSEMVESALIYGKNAVIEALESGEREFNKISSTSKKQAAPHAVVLPLVVEASPVVEHFTNVHIVMQMTPLGSLINIVPPTRVDEIFEKCQSFPLECLILCFETYEQGSLGR